MNSDSVLRTRLEKNKDPQVQFHTFLLIINVNNRCLK